LLYLTRSFEFAAVVLAWLIGTAIVVLARIRPVRMPSLVNLLAGTVAFGVTWIAVNAATGKGGFFLLYGNHLDEQRSTVDGQSALVSVAGMPTFSPSFVPTKLVQLFVEPCYYSMCSISDYAGGAETAGGRFADAEGSELLWRLPIAVQLPSLILLPICVVVLAALVVRTARHRRTVDASAARGLQGLVEMTVAASGLVLGYAASTMIGSSHLRYGLARDFLLPALLTAVVAVALVTAGIWRLLSSRNWGITPESVIVLLSVFGAVVMVAGSAYARAYGIPRLEGRQLGDVSYAASCENGVCDVSIDATTTRGDPIAIPDASTLTFDCGPGSPDVTVYAPSLDAGVRLTSCLRPRLTHAWPTVAGLPPGAYELRKAVRVSNV
jgi:hypothetical protein